MAAKIVKVRGEDQPMPAAPTQRKRVETARYSVQVDRQTKAFHETAEAAEAAGMAIKKGFPLVQVVIYDSVDSVRRTIELA